MISIDRRDGSSDLSDSLRRLGAAVSLEELPFGDFAFVGHGPSGANSATIGLERKTIGDLLACIGNGRYAAHQLPGMLDLYDYSYLIVEGTIRPSKSGMLEVLRLHRGVPAWQTYTHGARSYTYKEIDSFLTTLSVKTRDHHNGPVIVRRTSTPFETAYTIYNAYRWWTSKPFDAHRSLDAVHITESSKLGRQALADDSMMLRRKRNRPDHVFKTVALQLPKIGYEKLEAMIERFGSIRAMFNANETEWAEIDGIGPKIAREMVETAIRDVRATPVQTKARRTD